MVWINAVSEFFTGIYTSAHNLMGDGLFIAILVFAFIAVVAQWRLYEKANQPGYACLVPVWNVIIFLRIIGRPWQHIFYLLIPVFNIFFLAKLYIELCNSFGKTSILDYVLVILFNGFYILNLGLSYEERYYGPVYEGSDSVSRDVNSSTQLA